MRRGSSDFCQQSQHAAVYRQTIIAETQPQTPSLAIRVVYPRTGGTTAYRGASSGWPMEEALCDVTLKGCAE